MRKSRATAAVSSRLGLPHGRSAALVQWASAGGLLPSTVGKSHPVLRPADLAALFLAIIADRGLGVVVQSVATFAGLADANGNTLAETLEAFFAGRLPVSDSDDLVLSLQPGAESATLGNRRFGSTLPSSAAARVVAIPADSLAGIADEFIGAMHGR